MDIKALIGIFLGLGISSILMYGRKKIPNLIRNTIGLLGLVSGTFGLILTDVEKNPDLLMHWGMMSVGLYYIFDRVLFILNYNLQDRDFILWLRGSNEIQDYGSNPQVSNMDKISSIISLFFIVILMGLGAHLFRDVR